MLSWMLFLFRNIGWLFMSWMVVFVDMWVLVLCLENIMVMVLFVMVLWRGFGGVWLVVKVFLMVFLWEEVLRISLVNLVGVRLLMDMRCLGCDLEVVEEREWVWRWVIVVFSVWKLVWCIMMSEKGGWCIIERFFKGRECLGVK